MAEKRHGNPGCQICGGSGWIVEERDGREVARRCRCYFEGAAGRMLENAGIPAKYRGKSIENFTDYNQDLKAVKKAIKAFVSEYPAVEKGLLLVGPSGTGKTHLAVAALTAAVRKCRVHGLFCDYNEFIRSIQDSYNSDIATTAPKIVRPILDAELLLLDDLGAHKPTEWVRDTITYVINNRYTKEKITIFTSNYSVDTRGLEQIRLEQEAKLEKKLKKLDRLKMGATEYNQQQKRTIEEHRVSAESSLPLSARIGERLMSRIYEMCDIVPFDGVQDFRINVLGGSNLKRTRK